MNAIEVAESCRDCGLYPEQIQQWWAACELATVGVVSQSRAQREAEKALQWRAKMLERFLHYLCNSQVLLFSTIATIPNHEASKSAVLWHPHWDHGNGNIL